MPVISEIHPKNECTFVNLLSTAIYPSDNGLSHDTVLDDMPINVASLLSNNGPPKCIKTVKNSDKINSKILTKLLGK